MRSHYMAAPHRAVAADPALRRQDQAQPVRECCAGTRRGGARLDRARHDVAQVVGHDPRSRSARGNLSISSPPTVGPCPLWHRHADARGDDRVQHRANRSATSSAPTRSATVARGAVRVRYGRGTPRRQRGRESRRRVKGSARDPARRSGEAGYCDACSRAAIRSPRAAGRLSQLRPHPAPSKGPQVVCCRRSRRGRRR